MYAAHPSAVCQISIKGIPYNSRSIKKHRFHKEFTYVTQTAYCSDCLQ